MQNPECPPVIRDREVIEGEVIEAEVIEGEVIEGGSYRGRRLLSEKFIEVVVNSNCYKNITNCSDTCL